MAIVVDASVALAALLPDERSSYARAAFTVATSDGLIVPSLWLYEVQNGLRMAVRRARIVADFVPAALAALEAIPRDLRIPRRLARELILAETYGLTVYDAA